MTSLGGRTTLGGNKNQQQPKTPQNQPKTPQNQPKTPQNQKEDPKTKQNAPNSPAPHSPNPQTVTSLVGAPKPGTSLGGAPKGGTSLGGAPKGQPGGKGQRGKGRATEKDEESPLKKPEMVKETPEPKKKLEGLTPVSPVSILDPKEEKEKVEEPKEPIKETEVPDTALGGAKTTGTSLGGAKPAGTSLGGAKPAGTSLGGAKPAGTSLGGAKPAGTSLGGAKPAGTSLGGVAKTSAPPPKGKGNVEAKPEPSGEKNEVKEVHTVETQTTEAVPKEEPKKTDTALGEDKPAGTALGGSKPAGTALGGSKPAGTALGGAKPTGTALGGAKPAGTALGEAKPAGTALGGAKPAGTSLGGAKPAGTALGGSKPAGIALGGAKPAGTASGGDKPDDTALRGDKPADTALGGDKPADTALGDKPAGTALGGSKPAGTSIGGAKPAGTALGGAKPAGTALGGAKPAGTALGGAPKQTGNAPKPKPANVSNETQEIKTPEPPKEEKKKEATTEVQPQENKAEPPQAKKKTEQPQAQKQPQDKKKKPVSAVAKLIKKRQEEEERLKREEEERKKREEEEERLRIEEEKRQEEERQRLLEEKKVQRELQKQKQKELELQRKREQAAAKYGMVPAMIGPKPGRGEGGRGEGGRGGRGRGGGRKGGRNLQQTEKKEETKEPEIEEEKKEEEKEKEQKVEEKMEEKEEIKENWEEEVPEAWDTEEIPPPVEKSVEKPVEKSLEKPVNVQNQKDQAQNQPQKPTQKVTQPTNLPKPKQNQTTEEKKLLAQQQKEANLNKNKPLRSAIVCVLGHVDTGKTLLLDKMRSSNVQGGEAGGITQQIGATFFPLEMIKEMTIKLEESLKKQLTYKLPGLLIIDTPGHESFTNLRSRGSSLCDIAILVVDIMHGVEPQTRESLNILKKRRTPFVIALNKVDRCYGWKPVPGAPITVSLNEQDVGTKLEFEDRVKATIADLAAESLNAELYYRNKDMRKTISMVPTSAFTGEGIPDLLLLLVQLSQNLMADRLLELSDLNCTVLEVKKTQGHGTTLDVILANGVLRQHDRIMICGLNGEPIITTIKSILMPPAATELRIKSEYQSVKIAKAAVGCKIDAPGIDEALAGSPLFVINPGDDVESYKKQVIGCMSYLQGKIDKSGVGVYVQTSTLGSMEALLEYLKEDCKIPVSGIRIGTVHKIDVMRASTMLERKREYAVILAFDVEVADEARLMANKLGVRIFEADIIYHLFDKFTEYTEKLKEDEITKANKEVIIFPCVLRIIGKETVFRKRDPIVVGVRVEGGILRPNTPIVVFSKKDDSDKDAPPQKYELGVVKKIERDKGAEIKEAKIGDEVAIEIAVLDEKKQKYSYGRHFDESDLLYSQITREAIDGLKKYYIDLVKQREVYDCIVLLKKVLNIN